MRWSLVGMFCLLNVLVWPSVYWRQGDLKVFFLDVGQGDAILVRARGGRTVLIDGGPGKVVLERLGENLPLLEREIDLVIETHPDSDHAGGLPDVLKKYRVRGVLKPCVRSENSADLAMDRLAQERSVDEICAAAGQRVALSNDTEMEIVYAGTGETKDTNGASVISRLTFGQTAFLFAGDATEKVERYLFYVSPEILRADVYKVSHHGSRESNDEEFLGLVRPKLAVISAGAENRYGHPHSEVLDMLEKLGTKVLRTDLSGDIVLSSDGREVVER